MLHGSVYLFAIALVALVGALVMGGFEHDVRRWGWVAGALVAAIGYPVGWVSLSGFKLHEMSKAEQEAESRRPRQAMGPVRGSLTGILLGMILGVPVWGVIMVFWISLALSPLTPDSWREGFQTSVFFVSMPPRATLIILATTSGGFAVLGIMIGLCGRMYQYGPAEHKA